MAGPKDDLEAVREIAATLDGFSESERERIIRWVCEKLEMPATGTGGQPAVQVLSPPPEQGATPPPPPVIRAGQTDIRSFVESKSPKNDVQLSAVVAYYHRFMAPEDQRKDVIASNDLRDACRQAERTRPKKPAQTLGNAYRDGLLDRAEHGQYRLNSVGENLVAMVLPGDEGESVGRRTVNKRRGAKKAKKVVKKKTTKKVKKKTKKKTKKKAKKKAKKAKSKKKAKRKRKFAKRRRKKTT